MMDVQTGDTEASTLTRLQSLGLSDTRGKHWVQAEVKRLEQEIRFLEEELEQLEKVETASMACKEMLNYVESKPDPLLLVTIGSVNPLWDRWFEGPQEAEGCNCRIM